jgi:hypothetical protein
MQFSQIIELVKIVLECLIVGLGWVFVRRLEQIKSEVARHSDFSRKWADLFFDTANALMISVERIVTYASLITSDKDGRSPNSAEWGKQMSNAFEVFVENKYRISRLSALASTKGQASARAADELYDSVAELLRTKRADIAELLEKINTFNRSVREAHSEMIASRRNSQ